MSDGTVSQKSTSPVTSAFAAVAGFGDDLPHDPINLDDARTGRAIGRFSPRDVVRIAIEHRHDGRSRVSLAT